MSLIRAPRAAHDQGAPCRLRLGPLLPVVDTALQTDGGPLYGSRHCLCVLAREASSPEVLAKGKRYRANGSLRVARRGRQ
jgi:hypothetical protein